MAEPLMPIDAFHGFVDGLDHPEGVAWGLDGYAYAGGESGQVYRVDLRTATYQEIARTGGFTLGVTLDGHNNVYTCNSGLRKVMKISPDGRFSVYSDGSPARKFRTPNYAVFDGAGNLYVSDSGDFLADNGCLIRIRPGGATEVVSEHVAAFPNGMALGPGGRELYVVLSTWPGVVKVALHADGSVGEPVPVVELPRTVPDGLAFDVDGGLYISCYAPSHIYRLSSSGEPVLLAADWMNTFLAGPTNLAFGGADLRTLLTANLSRWHLNRADLPVAGLPLEYPAL